MTIPNAIVAAAQAAGIDPQIAVAVANRESGMNPNVRDGAAGEIGIFQIVPSTGGDIGYTPTQLRDPLQNIQAGVAYLARMFSKYQNPAAAVAAYNAGPGRVDSALANYGSDWFAHIPASTQAYVTGILGAVSAAPSAPPPITVQSFAPVTSTMILPPMQSQSAESEAPWGTLAIAVAVIFGVGYILRN